MTLKGMIYVFWILLPSALDQAGLWVHIPQYSWNFMMSLLTGVLTGVSLLLFQWSRLFRQGAGTMDKMFNSIHSAGTIPLRYVLFSFSTCNFLSPKPLFD